MSEVSFAEMLEESVKNNQTMERLSKALLSELKTDEIVLEHWI